MSIPFVVLFGIQKKECTCLKQILHWLTNVDLEIFFAWVPIISRPFAYIYRSLHTCIILYRPMCVLCTLFKKNFWLRLPHEKGKKEGNFGKTQATNLKTVCLPCKYFDTRSVYRFLLNPPSCLSSGLRPFRSAFSCNLLIPWRFHRIILLIAKTREKYLQKGSNFKIVLITLVYILKNR